MGRPRLRHQPLGHLPLHHHHETSDVRRSAKPFHDHRRADVVGQVGHHHPGPGTQRRSQIDVGDIHEAKFHARSRGHRLQHRPETLVDLICDHARTRLGQRHRQSPGPGAYLDYLVSTTDTGNGDDLPGHVSVRQEMLAEPLRGPQAMLGEKTGDLASGLCAHRKTSPAFSEVRRATSSGDLPQTRARASPT